MPTIYDNINTQLLEGLTNALTMEQAKRADICVGYINLRGWKSIAQAIDKLPGQAEKPPCRLIVGMPGDITQTLRNHYIGSDETATSQVVSEKRKQFTHEIAKQLTIGIPKAEDEKGLRKFADQLRKRTVVVKFFGAHSLHAKLYLAHREDRMAPITGFLGSSNLTFSGIQKQGELNVDVLEQDAAKKLSDWFSDRWNDPWCLDITDSLAEIIEDSWAGGPIDPYEIYVKTAYELSKEAREGADVFKVPQEFKNKLMEYQEQAVSLAAERLNRHGGVLIGDVVGLGKTLVASAIAKIFQKDRYDNVLVICPTRLTEMWKDYLHDYRISGKVQSFNQANQLANARHYQLVIIDESHNLRNREGKRYNLIKNYLDDHYSRVILLTATPYNKELKDIGSQLRLFVDAGEDLGIRPELCIKKHGGISNFKGENPNTLPTSLAAFEESQETDDWRELTRMFMIRRTRSYIKKNYAEFDENRKQHFLTYGNNERFYFPDRIPQCKTFSLRKNDSQDQYALLYSQEIVDKISNLKLPRYGIARYLLEQYNTQSLPENLADNQKQIIRNLTRAGGRLLGFAKSNLFKRLESCGPAFLISVRRHIIRNAVYLTALQTQGEIPIGDALRGLELGDEETDDEYGFGDQWDNERSWEDFQKTGKKVYQRLCDERDGIHEHFDWLPFNFFQASLSDTLRDDCLALLDIINKVPEWNVATDRKLAALIELCRVSHPDDKILIFTQYKDTAEYLHQEFQRRKIAAVGKVFGGTNDISNYIKRFSPKSNNVICKDELRILITTDTLSEGQNLQDAHIIVNFDLPWTLIRLVQRAGRIDRIGQKSREVLCYCFLPEDGIENIIQLRERLQLHINQNAQVIGSEEQFFEDDQINLHDIYAEKVSLEDEEEAEDETDLISRAYDIWRKEIKDNPKLEKRIENLPDVVYSAKSSTEEEGAIAYVKTTREQSLLVQLDKAGEVISQSQPKILKSLECQQDEPQAQPAENHHDLVKSAVEYVTQGESHLGGALGGATSVRKKIYIRLNDYQREREMFNNMEKLNKAVEQIFNHPLKETTKHHIGRQLRAKISSRELANMVVDFYEKNTLCDLPKTDEPPAPRIICSMGLKE